MNGLMCFGMTLAAMSLLIGCSHGPESRGDSDETECVDSEALAESEIDSHRGCSNSSECGIARADLPSGCVHPVNRSWLITDGARSVLGDVRRDCGIVDRRCRDVQRPTCVASRCVFVSVPSR